MSERKIREGLGKISKDQAVVLYWTLQGKSPDWIAGEILKKERKTYDYHMGEIYTYLGFTEKEHWTVKRERLIREVYPIFSEFVKTKDDLEKWQTIKYEYAKVKPPQEQSSIPEEPQIFIKDETPASGQKQQSQTQQPRQPTQRKTSWPLVLLGFGAGALISCIVIGVIFTAFFKNRPASPMPTFSGVPTSPTQAIIIPNSTDTASFTPTSTLTPTNEPTSTQTPTNEPTETSIPTLTWTPVPTQVVLFQEDFSSGLSPQMSLLSGNVSIVNGELSSAEDGTTIMIGDNSWTNYSVKFLGMPSSCWSSWGKNYIGLHAKDRNNMIALLWQGCEVEWYIVKNGKWNKVVNSWEDRPTQGNIMNDITIDVYDGNYIVNINGDYIYQIYDTTYNSGGIIFILEKGTKIDDIKVVNWQ